MPGGCRVSWASARCRSLHEWPEAKDWLQYATLLYYTSYPAWGGDDGGWQEGPGYWGAYMQFALHYVVALREAAGVDLDAEAVLPQHALLRALHRDAVPSAQPVRRRPDRQPARTRQRDVRVLHADSESALPLARRRSRRRRSGPTC